jgi:hypothetical protein
MMTNQQEHDIYDYKCQVCCESAKNRCSRCKKISYCGRDCQIKDWARHKLECEMFVAEYKRALDQSRVNFVKLALERIKGNIFIYAAHIFHDMKTNGVVIAEITEPIEEFCLGGSFHFAHLSFAPAAEYKSMLTAKACESVIDNIDALTPDFTDGMEINVVFKFNNYTVLLKTTPKESINFALLRTYTNPGNTWSIVFDI